jgi:arginase family enzyme
VSRAYIRPIICNWDGSSRIPGPSGNADAWRPLLSEHPDLHPPLVLNRRLGEAIPPALTACCLAVIDDGQAPLLLGGDHRLTFSVLDAISHRFGRATVHQFDAHHDAHADVMVNNYSVFRYAETELGHHVVRYGCREAPPAHPIRNGRRAAQPSANSAYVSIDLDYLDPAGFSCVSFPSPVPAGMTCSVDTLVAELRRIGASGPPVVGADMVEWCGDRATDREREQVRRTLSATIEMLTSSAIHRTPRAIGGGAR